MRSLMLSPIQTIAQGEVLHLPHPSPRDIRDLAVAFGFIIDKHTLLDQHDTEASAAKGLLGALAAQLGLDKKETTP